MSDTFVVAARLRLKKKAVTAWLRDVPTPPTAIEGWGTLFDELDPGRAGLPDVVPVAKSVRHVLAGLADGVAASEVGGFVAAWDGTARSFLLYHVMVGWEPVKVAATLSALASATGHWTLKKPTTALVFAETSGRLWARGAMATLSIGQGHVGVATGVDVAALVTDLAPAEQAWRRSFDLGLVDAMHEPDILQPAIRQLAKSPLLAKRRLQVPVFESVDNWLAAIGDIELTQSGQPSVTRYLNFGRFERDIMAWASQASGFGPGCHEALLAIVAQGPWERAVVALWGCNVLALSTGDGSYYLTAVDRWREAPHSHMGWGRGELTDDLAQARLDHKAALAGTPQAGQTFHRLITG